MLRKIAPATAHWGRQKRAFQGTDVAGQESGSGPAGGRGMRWTGAGRLMAATPPFPARRRRGARSRSARVRPGQLRGHHAGGATRVPGLAQPVRDDSGPADADQERPAEIEPPLPGRTVRERPARAELRLPRPGRQSSRACGPRRAQAPARRHTPEAAPRCTPLHQRGSSHRVLQALSSTAGCLRGR